MARIKLTAESFKPVEGHPLILVSENNYDGCKIISVLNVVNRIHYVIFKNDHTSVFIGSNHIDYYKGSEPTTLDELTKRLICSTVDSLLNSSTTEDNTNEILCSLSYIENGFIKNLDTCAVDGFAALKDNTTDTEIVEVLEKILNE